MSHDFSEELDDIDPDQLLELYEWENLNPIERAIQEQLQEYEQSIGRSEQTLVNQNNQALTQKKTTQQFIQTQNEKQEELQKCMEHQLFQLHNDEIEQLKQIQAVQAILEEAP